MKPLLPVLVAAFAATASSSASAQEFYFGGGLAYTSGTSKSEDGNSSELDAGMLTLILGQRFAAGSGFWGWETSADLSFGSETEESSIGAVCSVDGANGPYLCEHKATVRLVGLYGVPIADGTEVFGSLGVGMMLGDYANSPTTVESAYTYGATVGLGVNRDFGGGLVARGEVIYDSFNRDTQEFYESDYSGTSLRVALIRKF
jgi:Outer membrane protein beta-barrel domain